MAVDISIQFNGHNSYKVTTSTWCYPFGVDGMSYITHSFQAFANSVLASATRAQTIYYASDGSVVSTDSHAFAVTTLFEEQEITSTVPATAVKAQLKFLQGGTDWWVAEPKSEEGQTATPYNINYAGQLTYITPNGVYTGMLTTSQIVVTGSLVNPSENLEARLITINNNAITLSNNVDNKTTHITSAGVYTGEIVATQITSGSINVDRLSAKSITGAKLADGTVTATQIANATITAAKIANATITDAQIASLSATKITTGKLQSVDGKTWFDLTVPEIVQTATIGGKAVRLEVSPANPLKLSVYANTKYQDYLYLTDATGFSGANILVTSKYDVNEDGVVDAYDLKLIRDYILRLDISPGVSWPEGYPVDRMDVNDDGSINSTDLTLVHLHSTSKSFVGNTAGNQLGVDTTGVWMSDDWGTTKTYIHYF